MRPIGEKFIGRNRTLTNARALESALPLTNSEGAVLDPCLRFAYQSA